MPSKRIIQYAINQCKNSDCEFKIGCVLFKGGAVLRTVTNSSQPMSYRKKYFFHKEPSKHAELWAIHNISRDVIEKCSLLVVRVDRFNKFKSAKPCHACVQALYDAGIRRVYYSSYSGEIMRLNFEELLQGNYSKEYASDFV